MTAISIARKMDPKWPSWPCWCRSVMDSLVLTLSSLSLEPGTMDLEFAPPTLPSACAYSNLPFRLLSLLCYSPTTTGCVWDRSTLHGRTSIGQCQTISPPSHRCGFPHGSSCAVSRPAVCAAPWRRRQLSDWVVNICDESQERKSTTKDGHVWTRKFTI